MRVWVFAVLMIAAAAVGGCGAIPAAAPTTIPSPVFAQTPTRAAVGTATARPSPTARPFATATPILAELVLRWDNALIADADDVHEIVLHLKNTAGIVGGTGDEVQVTILYDPQLITPEQIQRLLLDLGYRTKRL